jgi:hypothetical protein
MTWYASWIVKNLLHLITNFSLPSEGGNLVWVYNLAPSLCFALLAPLNVLWYRHAVLFEVRRCSCGNPL